MISRFPSIELGNTPLVLDASVVINFLATGIPEQLLRTIGASIIVADEAAGEVRRHPISHEDAGPIIAEWVASGLIQRVELNSQARVIFHDLVADDLAGGLDDGEAATIAVAVTYNSAAVTVIDEKKAGRIFAEKWPERQLIDTVTLLMQREIRGSLPEDQFGNSIFSALKHARMRVRKEHMSWVVPLIGVERARECSSLNHQLER